MSHVFFRYMINLPLYLLRRGRSARPKDHLGTPEYADSFSRFLMDHLGVPHLRVSPSVNAPRGAKNIAFPSSAQVVRFRLDRREALGARGQVRDAPIPCRRIRHGNEGACVQIAVWRQQASIQSEQRVDLQLSNVGDHQAKESGKIAIAKLIEERLIKHRLFPESVEREQWRTESTKCVFGY